MSCHTSSHVISHITTDCTTTHLLPWCFFFSIGYIIINNYVMYYSKQKAHVCTVSCSLNRFNISQFSPSLSL